MLALSFETVRIGLNTLSRSESMSSLNGTTMNATSPTSEPANAYDHQGAAIYIAVILVWYSTGLAMMLFLQVRPRSLQQHFLFDSMSSSTKKRPQSLTANPFANYRNIQADSNTKQILNELKDPERRQRLWKIYYASPEKENESHSRFYQTINSDTAAIDRINRKLADIHRLDINKDGDMPPASMMIPTSENRSNSTFDSSRFFAKRFQTLRRPLNLTPTSIRTPQIRLQPALDAPPSSTPIEMEPLVSRKPILIPLINGSRKRSSRFGDRFIIEKVSNVDRTLVSSQSNSSEREWMFGDNSKH